MTLPVAERTTSPGMGFVPDISVHESPNGTERQVVYGEQFGNAVCKFTMELTDMGTFHCEADYVIRDPLVGESTVGAENVVFSREQSVRNLPV